MNVLQFPLSRITLGFIPGIIAAYFLRPNLLPVGIALTSTLSLLLISYSIPLRNSKQIIYFGIAVYLLAFAVGMCTQILHSDYYFKTNYIFKCTNSGRNHVLKVTLRERLKPSPLRSRYVAIVHSIDAQQATGSILINLPTQKTQHVIGTQMLVKGKIIRERPLLNLGQFDYGKYLENKSIYGQIYAMGTDVKIYPQVRKDIWYYSDALRNKMIHNLRINGFQIRELAVISALILGQQQDIAPEILHDYQFAGAVHILSVSGLHVGFILLMLNFVLKWLPQDRKNSAIKFLIILFSLWGFAVLAGFSPSVVRSVTMFSFLAWGMHLRRSTNIFHTLLISLLLILLFRPAFLFDVGFQLSYIALFFILWLQPMFSILWNPKHRITKYFWDILTVSFAAQIGAFPLSIYYFHQFPGLFFVTNILVIPFLGIIMSLGVFVLVLSAFGCVPHITAKALEWCILTMDNIIAMIASCEKFTIVNIPFTQCMLFTCYLSIIGLIIWCKKPTFVKLALALIALVSFQGSLLMAQFQTSQENELIVFHVPKKTIYAIRKGNKVFGFSDLQEIEKNQVVKSYLIATFSAMVETHPVKNVNCFNKNQILIIDSSAVYLKNIHPDELLLTQSPKLNFERLLKSCHPRQVIADGSNYKATVNRWMTSCQKANIPFHYTGEKGCYILKK